MVTNSKLSGLELMIEEKKECLNGRMDKRPPTLDGDLTVLEQGKKGKIVIAVGSGICGERGTINNAGKRIHLSAVERLYNLANVRLRTRNHLLRMRNHLLRTRNHLSRMRNHLSRMRNHLSRMRNHLLRVLNQLLMMRIKSQISSS